MERITTLPAAIKTRIEEIPELEKNVVIFKSANVEADFNTRMGKVGGKVAIIRVTGGKNEASGKKSAYACVITVSLFMVPSLKATKDCETLMTEIEAKLHGWWPDSVASNTAVYLKSESISFPENTQFDIAVLALKSPPTPLI